ncbi:MAG: hypothetical protein ACRC92_26910 [Peptostreptococcaceae bacterium]
MTNIMPEIREGWLKKNPNNIECVEKIKLHVHETLVKRYPNITYTILVNYSEMFGATFCVHKLKARNGRPPKLIYVRRYEVVCGEVKYYRNREYFYGGKILE